MAIINFFTAIADGKIDETERNMMGAVYVVLRVAMVIILLTSTFLTYTVYLQYEGQLSSFVIALWTLVSVLYLNAILMTKHIMPSTVGPALQASTWYTLGVTFSLFSLGVVTYPLLHFYLAYAAAIVLAIAIVNGMMAYLKQRKS